MADRGFNSETLGTAMALIQVVANLPDSAKAQLKPKRALPRNRPISMRSVPSSPVRPND